MEQPRAGVSAEDLVAVVRVHLDRVHDAARRLGADPEAAVEVVETSALDLVEAVAERPESVDDAVGWWFARARTLVTATAAGAHDLPLGRGVLAEDGDQRLLSEALDRLDETDRLALLLRDSYDLADVSVAAALGTGADAAMEQVGRSRLAFLPLVDDRPAPPLDHGESLAALARLGEGGQVASRDATVRRHALSCTSCRAVTDAQQRAHLLLSGLAVVAMPESERAGVLARAEALADQALPTSADLVLAGSRLSQQRVDRPRGFSPLLAVVAMVLAVLLGLGAGLLLSRDGGPDAPDPTAQPSNGQLITPPPSPAGTLASPPTVQAPAPPTTVFEVPPSPSPEPSPSPVPVVEELQVAVDPGSGDNGQTLTVVGRGWDAGVEVTVDYLDTLGEPTGSRAFAFVDDAGRFTTTLVAFDPASIPGPHVVQAVAGSQSTETTFDAGG